MMYTVFLVVSIVTSLHVLLLSIYFFRKPSIYKENLLFGGVLFLFSLLLISNTLTLTLPLFEYGKLLYIARHLSLLLIPLVYFYLNVVLIGKKYFLKDYLLHSLVFIITTPVLVFILYFIESFDIFNTNLRFVTGFLIVFQNSYYLWRSYVLINNEKNKKSLKDKIKWSKILFIGFLFIWMIQFCTLLLIDLYKNYIICPYTISMYFIVGFVLTYMIVFFLIETNKVASSKSKYRDSGISETEAKEIYHKIVNHFNEDQPYLDNQYSISALSKALDVSTKRISQVINTNTHSHFNDFVNEYRLKESEKILLESSKEEFNIAQVYFMVGYNSKSTFYTQFKKRYGLTPSQFRKQYSEIV